MCIMEVRPGQHSSTIAQACAHNLSTIDRDLDMFVAVLNARGDADGVRNMRHVQDMVHHAYEDALAAFEDEVTLEIEHWHTHDGEHVGNERAAHEHVWVVSVDARSDTYCAECGARYEATLIGVAHHDAELARRYETR